MYSAPGRSFSGLSFECAFLRFADSVFHPVADGSHSRCIPEYAVEIGSVAESAVPCNGFHREGGVAQQQFRLFQTLFPQERAEVSPEQFSDRFRSACRSEGKGFRQFGKTDGVCEVQFEKNFNHLFPRTRNPLRFSGAQRQIGSQKHAIGEKRFFLFAFQFGKRFGYGITGQARRKESVGIPPHMERTGKKDAVKFFLLRNRKHRFAHAAVAALEKRQNAPLHQPVLHLIPVECHAEFRQFLPVFLQACAEDVQVIMGQRHILELSAVIMAAETAAELSFKNADCIFQIGKPFFHVK